MSLHDLAFAGRTLRKSPVFALTAALTIALGVGASTAIFSVTNAVLLRPLPYKNPDQLVIIPSDMRNRGVKDFPFSNANFIDLREATKDEFQGLAGVFTLPITLTGEDGMPEKAQLGVVTTNYFQLVGARIVLGRDFIDDAAQRNGVSMRVIGRLRPGVTIGRAQAAVDQVAADARKNFSIENTAGYAIRVEPMRQHLVSEVRPAILALMGAVIFLLLIACANVANLLLVRASLRQHELAIRSAIGAGWWDLARQVLSVALLLAAMGALGGLAIAWVGIHELLAIAPAHLPRLDTIRIDSTVLIFTVI